MKTTHQAKNTNSGLKRFLPRVFVATAMITFLSNCTSNKVTNPSLQDAYNAGFNDGAAEVGDNRQQHSHGRQTGGSRAMQELHGAMDTGSQVPTSDHSKRTARDIASAEKVIGARRSFERRPLEEDTRDSKARTKNHNAEWKETEERFEPYADAIKDIKKGGFKKVDPEDLFKILSQF